MMLRYSVLIQWSDEDQAYLAILPEFGPEPRTHGATYAEAAKNAEEILELLVESNEQDGRQLPEPCKYADSASAS